jgi:hypothetical protein
VSLEKDPTADDDQPPKVPPHRPGPVNRAPKETGLGAAGDTATGATGSTTGGGASQVGAGGMNGVGRAS